MALWSDSAGYYPFLLDRVTSLRELWCQSQCNNGKLMSHCYFEGKILLYKQINLMSCTKPINARFFGYYALIVLLLEVHSSLAIAWELCFPKQLYESIVPSKRCITVIGNCRHHWCIPSRKQSLVIALQIMNINNIMTCVSWKKFEMFTHFHNTFNCAMYIYFVVFKEMRQEDCRTRKHWKIQMWLSPPWALCNQTFHVLI